MKKLFLISCVAMLLTTGCVTEPAAEHQAAATQRVSGGVIISPNDQRQYQTLVLPNKLEVLLVSDPSAEKSAASLSVGVGLLQDPMTQQGMAHYLEHMLFLGTERYPDTAGYSEFMTKNGGAHNAYTWLDITNYMFEANNSAYDEALDRFSDFFKAPKLYPEYAEKEKNAVNAEWSMRREMDFFGQFDLAGKMLGSHPANRFLIGNLESLGDKENSKLHDETVKFYQQYYSANIMKAVLVSNLPLADMELLARKHFSEIKNKDIEKPEITDQLDFSLFGGKRIHYVPNQDVKQIRLDFTIKNNSKQFAVKPNEFVTYLLGSEMPGTPAQQLKALGLISGLNASANESNYGNYGSLAIDVNLTDAGMQQREKIVAVLMQYIELIRQQGVDKKYFSEIQTSLSNQFRFLEKGDGFSYASGLSHAMQFVPAQYAVNYAYHYDHFDADAIKQVLQQLTPETLRVWYISKQEPHDSELHFYSGKYKITDISQQEQDSWQQQVLPLNLPQVNTLLPENFELKNTPALDKPEQILAENGIYAWLYPSKAFSEQPKGRLDIFINSPRAVEDIQAKVLFALWQDLYTLEQSVLITEASVAGIDFRISDGNGLLLNIDGFTDKQPRLLQQALAGLQPQVTAERLAQAVDRYVRGLQNQGKRFPFQQAFTAFNQLYRGGNYNTGQLIAVAKQQNVQSLQQFMTQVLAENQVRIFAFGNYDAAAVKALADEVNRALPAERKETAYQKVPYWKPAAGEVISLQQDIEVADVAVVDAHIHPQATVEQLARARVLQAHFSNNVFDKLRTEEQLAYAVGGTAVPLQDYTGFVLYIQTPVKGPQEMQQRFDQFKQQYATILDALPQAEFEQLKQSLLLSLKEPPKNLWEEVSPVVSDWYQEKYQYDSKQKLIAAVEQVTLDDIKAFYRESVLNPDAARLSVQLRGTSFKDKPFAGLPGQQIVTDLAEFQRTMTRQ
ncbi:insulinase family protein [Chromatiaceae bacterium AAb-1]|nr:insulinase family protein [Chromatiaceae bacterium AAb-1]